MPNWCSNSLTLKKHIAEKYLFNSPLVPDTSSLTEEEAAKAPEVDFGKLIPMPENMERTISPTRTDTIYIFLSEKGTKEVPEALIKKYKIEPDDIEKAKEYLETPEKSYYHLLHKDNKVTETKEEYDAVNSITPEEFINECYELGKKYVENLEKYGVANWYDWANKNWGTKWNACDSTYSLDGDEVFIEFDTAWGPPTEWLNKLAQKTDFELEYEIEGGYEGRGTLIAEKGRISEEWIPPLDYEEEEEEELDENEL